jgi:hypothetical protein
MEPRNHTKVIKRRKKKPAEKDKRKTAEGHRGKKLCIVYFYRDSFNHRHYHWENGYQLHIEG